MRALILHPGTAEPEVRDITADLDTLQGIVGGYIEPVIACTGDATLYVNEEGRFQRPLWVNERATHIAATVIYGSAVLLGMPVDGDDTEVPEVWLERLGVAA